MFALPEVPPKLDLQAIILAGNGNNKLYPLTQDDNLPKALLPIANKPMLYYQLNWLENAKIKDIIVIADQNSGKKIREYINQIYEVPIGTKIDVSIMDQLLGSADAIRHTDFVVMSCDSILTIPAFPLINLYRTENSSMISLVAHSFKQDGSSESSKLKDEDAGEFIAIDANSSQFLMSKSRTELDDDVPLRVSMLRSFPNVKLHSGLRNIHVYIFRKWVLDMIVAKKNLSSIKNELLPILLKAQYSKTTFEKEQIRTFIAQQSDFFDRARKLSSQPSEIHIDYNCLKCLAYVSSTSDICARSNSLWAYTEINRQVYSFYPQISHKQLTKSVVSDKDQTINNPEINSRTQLASDTLVGEGTKINERCSIKRSIIGSHCNIGNFVKIQNCIIMDYVTIEDGAKLEGCIVCQNVKVSEKCNLKDCEVGYGFIVDPEVHSKNEIFV